ncbi:MAG: TIGR01777 family oxidoreductase [Cyanobacteria bacterium P01_H01_bin.15]
MKIAITGATGFVGSRLVEKLSAANHEVLVLTRNPERGKRLFPVTRFPKVQVMAYEPLSPGEWQQELSGCDGVINLAGEPVAERWTSEHKRGIMESRRLTTENLVAAIAKADPKPTVLVNASAVGYYGTSETTIYDEQAQPGDDFLAQVCKEWELAAKSVTDLGVRLAIIRIGIVLGKGGALQRMVGPFQLFAGGPIGTGKQWLSWIHRDDLVDLFIEAVTNPDYSGVYNGTAPNPVRMTEFCQAMGDVMNRPSWLPVPSLALELLLGDGAKVVLEGQQVLPRRTEAAGFTYKYSSVKPALKDAIAEF